MKPGPRGGQSANDRAEASPGGEPMTLAQVLALAEQHRQGGGLALAEDLCRQVLRIEPRNAAVLHQLGIIAAAAGKAAEAIDLVRQAIAADGDIGLYHANLCEMCRRSRRLDEALAAGRRAIALALLPRWRSSPQAKA